MNQEQARRAANRIAAGHAYQKHVIGNKEFGKPLRRSEFALLIEHAILNCTYSRPLRRGRSAYWYRPELLLVIVDPTNVDGGTAYISESSLEDYRDLL